MTTTSYTVSEAAKYCNCSVSTIYDRINRGRFSWFPNTSGNKINITIPADEVYAYAKELKNNPSKVYKLHHCTAEELIEHYTELIKSHQVLIDEYELKIRKLRNGGGK